MSTLFFGLLSRTLQALLSKYLYDVDVEGLNVGGMFTDSGYGVRLSNVKLRDGTKLMDLPGSTPRTPRRGKNKKKSSQRTSTTKEEQYSPPSPNHSHYEADTTTAPSPPNDQQQDVDALQSRHNTTEATGNEPRIHNNRGDLPTPPKTVTYRKKSGWFSSWYSNSSIDETILEAGVEEDDDTTDERSPASSHHHLVVDTTFQNETTNTGNGFDHNNNGAAIDGPTQNEEEEEEGLTPPATSEYVDPILGPLSADSMEDAENDEHSPGVRNGVYQQQQQENDETGTLDEEEDDDDLPPMCLRLGQGGSVGTLDVRLVNKTMHILVEDADITVECVRFPPQPEEEDVSSKKTKTPKKSDPVTPGDRVLAKNILARIISGLPNLLLRDIRLRIVIRNNVVAIDEEEPEYGPDDTVIDVAIELLSVTDGSDFLLNFGVRHEEEEDDDDGYSTDSLPADGVGPNASHVSGLADGGQNEFLTKRIRTGRGPEGGVLLRIYDMGDVWRRPKTPAVFWARDTWCTYTEFVVLRLSGLDLQAKTFLGTRKEAAISRDGWYMEDANEAFSVDEIVFAGCDYIAPGPQPPLPSTMVGHDAPEVNGAIMDDTNKWVNPDATTFTTDSNGIQSCVLPSPFHRVARGFYPRHCTQNHLPCESCEVCWAKDFGSDASHESHELDSSTPLSGFVCHASLRDPLEINVDRNSLETFGLLISLFSKKKTDPVPNSEALEDGSMHSGIRNPGSVISRTLSGTFDEQSRDGSRADNLDSSRRSMRGSLDRSRRSTRSNDMGASGALSAVPTFESHENFDTHDAFPSYMQPENVQTLGIYLSKLRFRVHVLRENGVPEDGGAFGFLDIACNYVTLDYQRLSATERPFQDLRFDIGYLKVSEHKGTEENEILSLGRCQKVLDFDEMTVETFMTNDKLHNRSPWPTTAASLLDIAPTLESLPFEDRHHHGLQLRFSTVLDPISESKSRSRKCVIAKLGAPSLGTAFAIKNDVIRIIREARQSVIGPPKKPPDDVDLEIKKEIFSTLRYKVVAEAGHAELFPLIKADFPTTTLEGELSSDTGFSIRGFVERAEFQFGQQSKQQFRDKGLSLQQLAILPETVRLRILLFIKDLRPLEAALGLPPSSNSFLRCRAINNGISTSAKKASIESTHHQISGVPKDRRQMLVSELLSLDDDTLESLLESHRRNQKNDSHSSSL